MVVEFEAVDGVLPNDVAAGTYCSERVEVGAGYPDGESCVFLTEGLSAFHSAPEEVANVAPHGKLNHAKHKTHYGDGAE